MSGAVGKVAVLKKGPMSKLATLAMLGLAIPTGGVSLAPMLAGSAGRAGASKLATKIGQRVDDVKDAYQGAKLAQTQGVGTALGPRSPMKNAWEALRGREYTGTAQRWVPNEMPGYRSFNPNPTELGEKFIGSAEKWDEATGFQEWLKNNPAKGNQNIQQYSPTGELTTVSSPTTLQPSYPAPIGAGNIDSKATPMGLAGRRGQYATKLVSDPKTAMGHGKNTTIPNPLQPQTSDPFTPKEITALTGGTVGVASATSHLGNGLAAGSQARVAQQAEEARRLQERAAGAATGTTGSTQMGSPNASPTG